MYKNLFKEHYLFLFVGILIIFVSLYPFWLFGEYSALGFYDEINSQIPAMYLNNQMQEGQTFMHQFVGGVGTNLQFGMEHFSFYRLLADIFPLWIANLIFKFLSLSSLFLGMYILIINILKANKFFAFSAALFSVFTSYLPYGWSLGGHGWDLSIAVWISLAIFAQFNNYKINWIIALALVLVTSLLSSPIFLFPLAFFLALFILFGIVNFKEINKSQVKIITFIALFITLTSILNWNYLYYMAIDAKSFSARLLGILSGKLPEGSFLDIFSFYIDKNIKGVEQYHKIFSIPSLIIGYYVLLFLTILKLRFKSVSIFFLIGICIPIVLDAFAKASDLKVINTYRWEIVLYLLPVMLPILIGHLIRVKSKINIVNYEKFSNLRTLVVVLISIVLLVKALVGANILSNYAMNIVKARGGAGATFYYDTLSQLKNKDFRTVSDYGTIEWSVPLYYDMSTFDGVQSTFSYRRNYFMAYDMFTVSRDTIHRSNQFFYFSNNQTIYNLKAFEMANIKYIFTSRKHIFPNVSNVLYQKGIFIQDISMNEYIKEFLFKKFGNIPLVKDLYVYELNDSWNRVFSANNIFVSQYSFKDKMFYKELNILKKDEILIAKDDFSNKINIDNNDRLKIKDYMLTKTGVTINIDEGSGYLVYNEVYLPYWHAFCGNTKLNIVPTNGIMMAVKVPKECRQVNFNYSFD